MPATWSRLAWTDLAHLELGERPIRGLVQVGEGEPMGLVGAQPLHPAQHPVVVPRLGDLGHVLGGPVGVPSAHRLVLPSTHCRVRLQESRVSIENWGGVKMLIYFLGYTQNYGIFLISPSLLC